MSSASVVRAYSVRLPYSVGPPDPGHGSSPVTSYSIAAARRSRRNPAGSQQHRQSRVGQRDRELARDGDAVSHAARCGRAGVTPIDLGSLERRGGWQQRRGQMAGQEQRWARRGHLRQPPGRQPVRAKRVLVAAPSTPFRALRRRKICKGFRWAERRSRPLCRRLPRRPSNSHVATAANNRRPSRRLGAENGVQVDPTCDPALPGPRSSGRRSGDPERRGCRSSRHCPGDFDQRRDRDQRQGSGGRHLRRVRDQRSGASAPPTPSSGRTGSRSTSATWRPYVEHPHRDQPPAKGTIVGFYRCRGAAMARESRREAFVWTRQGGIDSLGKPPGDIRSGGVRRQRSGEQIVGLAPRGPQTSVPRPAGEILWQMSRSSTTSRRCPALLFPGSTRTTSTIAARSRASAFDPATGECAWAFVGTPDASTWPPRSGGVVEGTAYRSARRPFPGGRGRPSMA